MTDVPRFPLESLPKWLREVVDGLSTQHQTPPDMAALIALPVLATATRGVFDVEVLPGHCEPLAVFAAAIMEPGERKSSAAKIWDPLKEVELGLIQTWKRQHFEANATKRELVDETRKELEEALESRDPGKIKLAKTAHSAAKAIAEIDIGPMPTITVSDATQSGIVSAMADNHGCVGVFDAEGSAVKILKGRYNNGNAENEVLNKAYSGETHNQRRGKTNQENNINIPICFASIGILVQPTVFAGLGSTEMAGNGFLARFLFCMPKSMIGYRLVGSKAPPPVDPEHWDAWRLRITTIAQFANMYLNENEIENAEQRITLRMNPDARKIYNTFVESYEKKLGRDGELAPHRVWASKLPGTLVRIAALFAIGENYETLVPHDNTRPDVDILVSEEEIQLAFGLADYFIEMSRTTWRFMNGSSMAISSNIIGKDIIAKWIINKAERSNENGAVIAQFTPAVVKRGLRGKDCPFQDNDRTSATEQIERTLRKIVEECDWLTQGESSSRMGRPATYFLADIPKLEAEYGAQDA